jgi:2-keto-4-pentenoate hydratase/2-oxohepta-3-ene-1,7-dioic acid hydratase in catechol pathway
MLRTQQVIRAARMPQSSVAIEQWVTLEPGGLIYTGTPGNTKKMNPGDTVEVEIESIGVLRNQVA